MSETSGGRRGQWYNDGQGRQDPQYMPGIDVVNQTQPQPRRDVYPFPIQAGADVFGQARYTDEESDGSQSLAYIQPHGVQASPSIQQALPAVQRRQSEPRLRQESINAQCTVDDSVHSPSLYGVDVRRSNWSLSTTHGSFQTHEQFEVAELAINTERMKGPLRRQFGEQEYTEKVSRCLKSFEGTGFAQEVVSSFAHQLLFCQLGCEIICCLMCREKHHARTLFIHDDACIIQRLWCQEIQDISDQGPSLPPQVLTSNPRETGANIQGVASNRKSGTRKNDKPPDGAIGRVSSNGVTTSEETMCKAGAVSRNSNNGYDQNWDQGPSLPPQIPNSADRYSGANVQGVASDRTGEARQSCGAIGSDLHQKTLCTADPNNGSLLTCSGMYFSQPVRASTSRYQSALLPSCQSCQEVCSGNVQDQPAFPRFRSYHLRLESFNTWRFEYIQSGTDLALAGLFYRGNGDEVQCFDCGQVIRQWKDTDDAWIEHARLSPRCCFVLREKGQRFIDEAKRPEEKFQTCQTSFNMHARSDTTMQRNSEDSALLEMGFTKDQIQSAKQRFRKGNGNKQATTDELVDIILADGIAQRNEIDVSMCVVCCERVIGVSQFECGHIVCSMCAVQRIRDPCKFCGREVVKVVPYDPSSLKK